MIATAIAIRLDSKGPVFFRQRRYGFNNDLVEVWKFRSLHIDREDANAETLVTKGDTRVTRVGRFIRKTSIDELPQLSTCSMARCLSLDRARMPRRRRPSRISTRMSSRLLRPPSRQAGVTGWLRSTAGAAKPTRTRRSSAASKPTLLHRELVDPSRSLCDRHDPRGAPLAEERVLISCRSRLKSLRFV